MKNSTVEILIQQAAEYLRRGHTEVAWSVLRFVQYDLIQKIIEQNTKKI